MQLNENSRTDRNFPGPQTGYVSTFGDGDPVTLFAHGFAGGIRDTRPFAAGIEGTRALVHLGGHGGRPSPGPGWTYETVAAQLADALRVTRATRALGVSMSAGGLARLITQSAPMAQGLERVAFVLPASWAGFSPELEARLHSEMTHLRAVVEAGDREELLDWMLRREPAEVAQLAPAQAWAAAKVDALLSTDLADGVGLAERIAVEHPEGAKDFAGEVLVLTHEDDPSHTLEVAQAYADAFAHARLVVLPAGSILWRGRSEVRRVLTDFFND